MKMKLLVAALALVAAGSANAAIDMGQAAPATGGELFLVVTDTTAGYSFLADTGMSMDTFLAASNTNQSWDLTSYTAWAGFTTAIGGSLANAKYAVYAMDNIGAVTTVDNKRLLTTVAAGDDISGAAGNYSTSNSKLGLTVGATLNTALVNMQNVANNTGSSDHATVANGSSFTSAAKVGYSETQLLGDSLKNNTTFVTTVAAGSAADFWLLGNSSSSTLAQANTYLQAGQFSLSATSLNYTVAAVPEADSYALMLAGLGLVGFLARRRKAA